MTDALDKFMDGLKRRNPDEAEFHQAVQEVAADILPYIADHSRYRDMRVLERMTEPDRIVIFRVCWEDDEHNIRVNRGYRVQSNNAIGPYKGGIRFHPSVNLSILKFLAFEQTFKNSLTGLPLGGAKGGADYNPKDKSPGEVMRFCQAFMTELHRHIGPDTDVPAGDIGVGAREVGYMFGQYKRLENRFEGVLTGKAIEFGGTQMRTEATGYGAVYIVNEMLATRDESVADKVCTISGSGNVALYCAEKLIEEGAKVVTLSDSSGFIHDEDGLTAEKLEWLRDLKLNQRGRIDAYAKEFGCEFEEDKRPWGVPCDVAFPCATQNELEEKDAEMLVKNGCQVVSEGANMPTTPGAIDAFREAKVLHAPSKAANAGGVAASGLEMSQNSQRYHWSRDEVDARLRDIMRNIHDQCAEEGGDDDGYTNYFRGANVAGFKKVADAMLAYGVV